MLGYATIAHAALTLRTLRLQCSPQKDILKRKGKNFVTEYGCPSEIEVNSTAIVLDLPIKELAVGRVTAEILEHNLKPPGSETRAPYLEPSPS